MEPSVPGEPSKFSRRDILGAAITSENVSIHFGPVICPALGRPRGKKARQRLDRESRRSCVMVDGDL